MNFWEVLLIDLPIGFINFHLKVNGGTPIS